MDLLCFIFSLFAFRFFERYQLHRTRCRDVYIALLSWQPSYFKYLSFHSHYFFVCFAITEIAFTSSASSIFQLYLQCSLMLSGTELENCFTTNKSEHDIDSAQILVRPTLEMTLGIRFDHLLAIDRRKLLQSVARRSTPPTQV